MGGRDVVRAGAAPGSAETIEWGRLANENPPELRDGEVGFIRRGMS